MGATDTVVNYEFYRQRLGFLSYLYNNCCSGNGARKRNIRPDTFRTRRDHGRHEHRGESPLCCSSNHASRVLRYESPPGIQRFGWCGVRVLPPLPSDVWPTNGDERRRQESRARHDWRRRYLTRIRGHGRNIYDKNRNKTGEAAIRKTEFRTAILNYISEFTRRNMNVECMLKCDRF